MAETASNLDHRPASAASASSAPQTMPDSPSPLPLPRITIRFCTQCKWMLRASYFAQELLSTFSTSLGEVALQPATGGIFVIEIHYTDPTSTASQPDSNPTVQHRLLWDRKRDGGFPETKELKRRVRDAIEPGRNLGHVDRDYPRQQQPEKNEGKEEPGPAQKDPMPEAKHQQAQPVGPRWPQLNASGSFQPATQGQQTEVDPQPEPSVNTETHTSAQRTPRDLGPYPRQQLTDSEGPVYDPRLPGGGIMPVVPPVALNSKFIIRDSSSQVPPRPQQTREECEDCQ
ncbi:hypothetical protein GGS24DRAFT_495009 [Hypoxylon argillaceum]|nr:hypothetical protein GGS24DRAFT_495009 [Hypoxylon argillaceum]